jgi:two-component system sensor histidine kinase RegB
VADLPDAVRLIARLRWLMLAAGGLLLLLLAAAAGAALAAAVAGTGHAGLVQCILGRNCSVMVRPC